MGYWLHCEASQIGVERFRGRIPKRQRVRSRQSSYIVVKIARRGVDGVKVEPVQRVVDGLGLAVDVRHTNLGRADDGRKRAAAGERLGGPVEIGKAEILCRLDVAVLQRRRKLLSDRLDCRIERLLSRLLARAAQRVSSYEDVLGRGFSDVTASECSEGGGVHTSNRAKYGRCHVVNRIEEWVQYPPNPWVAAQSVLLWMLSQALKGMPWIPAIW